MEKQLIGVLGERLVCKKYTDNGYKLLTVNYDIIAQNNKTIVFIEVKTRKNDNFAKAGEAVTYSKQQKLKATAAMYLQEHSLEDMPARFDVAEVYAADKNPIINIIENAFE